MCDKSKISKELGGVNINKLSDIQLKQLDNALFGKHQIPKRKPKNKPKKTKVRKVDFSRNRVRLIFPEHKEYLKNIIDHLSKFDVEVDIMKTGLVAKVKNKDGYKLNLLNYLEVRLVSGELQGNLYLNRIKTEKHEQTLNGSHEHRRVKGIYTIDKVNEKQFKEIINETNMAYMTDLCRNALMLKKRRNKKRMM